MAYEAPDTLLRIGELAAPGTERLLEELLHDLRGQVQHLLGGGV